MTALIGVVVATAALATPLPPLPAQGLVLSQGNSITFVDLDGRWLGRVGGLRFATEYAQRRARRHGSCSRADGSRFACRSGASSHF
jgi:hypothetical protein